MLADVCVFVGVHFLVFFAFSSRKWLVIGMYTSIYFLIYLSAYRVYIFIIFTILSIIYLFFFLSLNQEFYPSIANILQAEMINTDKIYMKQPIPPL